mgnify:CR=1 FL=1
MPRLRTLYEAHFPVPRGVRFFCQGTRSERGAKRGEREGGSQRGRARGLARGHAVGRGASVGGFVFSSGAGGAPSSVAFRVALLQVYAFLFVSSTTYRISCPHVGAFPCGIPLRFLFLFSQGVVARNSRLGKERFPRESPLHEQM